MACGHSAKLVQLSDMTPSDLTALKDRPLRIGLIVPSSNTVMEPDFHQQMGRTAIISTTRIFLEEVTREEELRMLHNDLPKATELIRTTAPDVVIFGCTSAGALGTLAHESPWPE
jgi:maleate isomerase